MVLGLVVLDGLNPVVRIYAWRMLLGRNGIINGSLEFLGIIDKPIDALLFNEAAVIVVLSTSWITYTVIPVYAAMKAIDANLFQARPRPRRRLVDDPPADPAAPRGTGDLRRRPARLHPAVHRLRDADHGRRHEAATCSGRRSTT